jgi:hypothetical protein
MTFLASAPGIYTLYPKVEIRRAGSADNQNPSTATFEVTNKGFFSVAEVQTTFLLNDVRISSYVFKGIALKSPTRPFTSLRLNESATFSWPVISGRLLDGDMTVVVHCRFLFSEFTSSARFVTQPGIDHILHWFP